MKVPCDLIKSLQLGSREKKFWEGEKVCFWTVLFYLCCPTELDFLSRSCFVAESLEVEIFFGPAPGCRSTFGQIGVFTQDWFLPTRSRSPRRRPQLSLANESDQKYFTSEKQFYAFFLFFSLILSFQPLEWFLWYSHYSVVTVLPI